MSMDENRNEELDLPADDSLDEPYYDNKEDDTDELAQFRKQWEIELGLKADNAPALPKEDEAVGLYWMGAAAEKSGDMNAAIMYYRQAVQLVPDVEFKACSKEPETLQNELEDADNETDQTAREQAKVSHLTEQFQALHLEVVCQPARKPKIIHISVLPVEVLNYILCWVISAECDMRSLEQFGMVCRGFYLLARGPAMWRTACRKLWGECSPSPYGGIWRNMFIYKPHLHFNGVYISKTSYVRPGERSLDGFYKAYHTVVYFRYLRFFADGAVMYQTSPLDPSQVVGKLCHKHSSDAVLLGKYTVQNDRVTVDVFSYRCHHELQRHQRGRRGREPAREVTHEQRFHTEFLLKGDKRQWFNQLAWESHYCQTLHRPTGQVQVSNFNIDYKYTPFYFSRVKRFTTNSQGILACK